MDEDVPKQAVQDRWDDVEADLEATAEELEGEGWSTVTLHAGDVTSMSGATDHPPGLDVLVPDNEFEALEAELEAGAEFTETAVFREGAGGVTFLVCVLRDPDRRVAALFPAYYPQRGRSAEALAEHALGTGELTVFVRPLRRERGVSFVIDKPSLVFPEEHFPDAG